MNRIGPRAQVLGLRAAVLAMGKGHLAWYRRGFFIAAVLIGLLLMGSGCALLPEEKVDEVPVLLRPPETRLVTYEVIVGPIADQIRALGRVAAVKEAQLYFPRTERLKHVHVAPGETITEGQCLAELETGDLRYRLQRAQLALAQEELRWKRVENLVGIEINEIDYGIAQLELKKAQLEVDHLTRQLEASMLRAPFSGVVVSVDRRERELVEGYETVMTIADPSELEIQVELSYTSDVSKLVRGQKVLVNLGREEWVTGHIYQISTRQDDPSYARTSYQSAPFVIKIRLDDPRITLDFDSLVRVVIVIEEEPEAILVPNAAIRSYMGRKYVRVLEGDVRKEVDIVTGIEGETETQVLKGLKPGDIVIGK
ncbi:MAG: efflux RND transporter periplasmic adaptor subunit [Firmicutes bacterium]|nr:efflux RND transporter periplasmic adaptor subunit [Bacillota bacterium]